MAKRQRTTEPFPEEAIVAAQSSSYTLKDSKDLDPLLERIGDAHHVFLGEASHGTHEYYTWRTAITKRLIQEKGFNFIAVEGDWPDCYRLNRYVKGYDKTSDNVTELLAQFKRWPTWMWANWETDALLSWLKEYNSDQRPQRRVGFYGLDVYSLWESLETMYNYLSKNDPQAATIAQAALHCLEPYSGSGQQYALEQLRNDVSCRKKIVQLLRAIRQRGPTYDHDPEAALNMAQNGQIALNAESYYSNMISFDDNTWNLRDSHMMATFQSLMAFYEQDSSNAKGIVWAHNTHIGDARYTDMIKAKMHNIGQLARIEYGEYDTVLVGFATYSGTVIAGKSWDAPMEVMEVPEAISGSIEQALHEHASQDRLLIYNQLIEDRWPEPLTRQRAIGVVYHPEDEYNNYVPSVMNARYDALLFIDQTSALHPMHIQPDGDKIPETYPFAF